jgi:hypothetical protein
MQTKTMVGLVAAAMLAGTSSMALAQNTQNNPSSQGQAGSSGGYSSQMNSPQTFGQRNPSGNQQFSQNQNIPDTIRQKLQNEGYSNIRIEPGSFVVSATDEDGEPVMMMFGPHTAMMIRPMNQNNNMTTGSGSNQSQYEDQSDQNQMQNDEDEDDNNATDEDSSQQNRQ